MDFRLDERLETADACGFRRGMTCTGLIANKLTKVYAAPSDNPAEYASLLQAIERKFDRRR